MADLLLPLAALLSFLFGWNNSSFIVGNMRASATVKLGTSLGVAIVGLALGVILEGPKMSRSLNGGLASQATYGVLFATVVISVLLTLGLTVLRLPVSFSAAMVGAFLGGAYASAISVNAARAELVVGFWFISPLISGAFAFLLYKVVKRAVANLDLITIDSVNRTGVVLSSLAVSYSLGANNIGLIYGATSTRPGSIDGAAMAGLVLAAALGVLLLGKRGVSDTLGEKMLMLSAQGVITAFISSALLVWVGTQIGVPMSMSQCVLGGMFGATFARSVSVMNKKLVLGTIAAWGAVPVFAFALGYLLLI